MDPVRLQLLNELDNGIALNATKAGHFLGGQILDPKLVELKKELKLFQKGTKEFKAKSEDITKLERQKTTLMRINKKVLDSIAARIHESVSVVAAVGVAFFATPLALHVGLPILATAAIMELVVLTIGFISDLEERKEMKRQNLQAQEEDKLTEKMQAMGYADSTDEEWA